MMFVEGSSDLPINTSIIVINDVSANIEKPTPTSVVRGTSLNVGVLSVPILAIQLAPSVAHVQATVPPSDLVISNPTGP